MGDWRLEIYDKSNSTRQAIIPRSSVSGGTRVEELNGEDTLTFRMDRGSEHWDTIDLRDIIRLVDLGGNTSKSFRVRSIKDSRKGDKISGEVRCEHIKYDMLGEVYTRWKPWVRADPSSIIDDILDFSSFSSSTITPVTLMDAVLNFGTVLESLESIRARLDTDMFVNEDSTIKFGAHGNNNNVKIRYAKNMRGIERLQDVHTFFNKLYPFGAGEPPTSIGGINLGNIQGAEHIIETINGATYGLHERMVVSNDSLNDLYVEVTRANVVSGIGQRRRVLDSIANDTIVLATNFATTVGSGDYLKIVSNTLGDEVQFVKDQISINTHGTIGASLPLNDVSGIHNLLLNPDMSAPFVSSANGSVPHDWDEHIAGAGGSPFLSASSVPPPLYGDTSLKVENDLTAELGIQQNITLVDGDFYSFGVWVFIIDILGEVVIEFFDGTTDQPSSGEAKTEIVGSWVQLMIEGVQADGTAGIVRIFGQLQADVRITAAVVERKSRLTSPKQFSLIGGARDLWDIGVDKLREQTAPRKQYVIGIADLYEGDRKVYQYDQFEIGDTVTVQDDELGIDITARVRRKEWNIFDPWDAKVQLDNFADKLGRSLSDQQNVIKRDLKLIGLTSGRSSQERVVAGDDVQRITVNNLISQ